MASDASGFSYDVFLSFRGKDTRFGFTGNLWKTLHDRGIRTFIDDKELRKGDEISPSLVKAIEGSRMAIVVLSKNYESSSFCLQELSAIIDCFMKEKSRSVWPVFYDVDPSEVRWLTGTYGEALTKHEARWSIERLQKWKKALHHVANFSGFHYKIGNGYEHQFVGKIVEQVSREVKPVALPVADYLVGVESPVQTVTSLLGVGSDDEVHAVGIHGIGGIGKTTLAVAVYNSIAHQFEGSCYLENIRADLEKYGLKYFQKVVLSKLVGEKEIDFTSVREGISIMQQRLRQKKVLLLLDDVSKLEQLWAIAGKLEWFGSGSRILITTRDKGLLTRHGIESTYEMKELNKKDALELLKWKAFKTDNVSSSYVDVLNRAITYASGLPLALEVIGSHLVKKRIEEWESALERYERIPNKKIQEILKVSFDTLDEEEKSVFLDIACCFKGRELEKVEKILHLHHGYSMKDHIIALVEKSLIKINESGNVTLHDLIEDMGKEIVRQESPKEPRKRSRLWYHKDIVQVFEENMGTSKIEIICLDFWIGVKLDGEAFKKMENLRTLMIRQGVYFKSPIHLPDSLRVLEWDFLCSSWAFPLDFLPKKLVTCKLACGGFTSIMLGDLFKKANKFENMRVLNLCDCHFLTHIPEISSLPNLEELLFEHCYNLITIDDSIGLLDRLKILKARGCENLRSFPPLKMVSLEELILSQCVSLESFAPVVGLLDKLKILHAKDCGKLRSFPPLKLASLEELDLSNCVSLDCFPSVHGLLGKLKILSVNGCRKLRSIPPLNLALLEQLSISCCDSLESFPELIGEVAFLNDIPIKELSFSFENLTRLQILHLKKCGIVQLPSSIVVMPELTKLTIKDGGCLFPKQEEGEEQVSPMLLSQVKFLSLWNCNLSDGSLAIGLKRFANATELDLSESKFTILPECIKNCHFLWKLVLDNCEKLQEINGIPPSLKTFSALNCNYLASWINSKSVLLLNQELHEAGNTWFRVPQVWIPNWFDHQSEEGSSTSFWFRNKFPAIALCVVSFHTWLDSHSVSVMINGNTFFYRDSENNRKRAETFHLHLFHMQIEKFNDNLDKALLENKWNHVEVDFGFDFLKSGIHVLKEKRSMEDIRFTNPEYDVN